MPKLALDFNVRGSGGKTELYLPEQNAQRIQQADVALKNKSGWGDDPTSDVSISFVNGTRTFTITPSGSSFEYWIQGVKYTKTTAESVIIDDTEGLWFIYYIGTTLTASQTPWTIDGSVCFVAIIHWDAVNNISIIIGWELHLNDMALITHNYLHRTIGTRYETGFALTQGTGGNDGQIALTGGEIWDENINIIITDGGGGGLWEQELGNPSVFAPAQIPVFYRSGASAWRKYAVTNFPFYDNAGGDNVHYNKLNGTWASAAASSSAKYIAYWIYATNDIAEPVIAIMGQNESNTLAQAQETDLLENMDFGTLPFTEMKILYRIIFKSNSTTSNIEDMRSVSNLPGGTFVPSPTPTLDLVCHAGSEYNGAIASGSAVIIGDGTNTIRFYVSGGEIFILSDVPINILPSGDTDDYLQFYTSGGIPRIKIIGGENLYLEADGTDTLLTLDGGDDAAVIIKSADDAYILYKTGATNKFTIYYDLGNDWVNIFAYQATTSILMRPSGDSDDYLQFYTSANIPRIKVIGGSAGYLESDGGSWISQTDFEIITGKKLILNNTTAAEQLEITSSNSGSGGASILLQNDGVLSIRGYHSLGLGTQEGGSAEKMSLTPTVLTMVVPIAMGGNNITNIAGIEIKTGNLNQIRIYDRDGDADSYINIYYDKIDSPGLRLFAIKDGAYSNKPLYLFTGAAYKPALYDSFPDAITFGSGLTLGGTLVMGSNEITGITNLKGSGHFGLYGGIGSNLNLYSDNGGKAISMDISGNFRPAAATQDLGQNSATTWDVVYYHTLTDKTCASFVGYDIEALYNMLKAIQPRNDGILHHDKNNKKYFPHIDMATVPDELACFADEPYTLENMPIRIENKIENNGIINFKNGDKCGVNFNTMVYAMNELLVLQYEKIKALESKLLALEIN